MLADAVAATDAGGGEFTLALTLHPPYTRNPKPNTPGTAKTPEPRAPQISSIENPFLAVSVLRGGYGLVPLRVV